MVTREGSRKYDTNLVDTRFCFGYCVSVDASALRRRFGPGPRRRALSGAVGAGARRVLLLVGLVFAAWPACSALAETVGHTGTPSPAFHLPSDEQLAQNNAVIPAAGVVTSFHTRASATCPTGAGRYNFQVLRPLGGHKYKVVGDTGNHTDPCDGRLHSYPVHIAVHAGDVLGVYVVRNWDGVLTETSGSLNHDTIPLPTVGHTVTLSSHTTGTANVSATFQHAKPQPPKPKPKPHTPPPRVTG